MNHRSLSTELPLLVMMPMILAAYLHRFPSTADRIHGHLLQYRKEPVPVAVRFVLFAVHLRYQGHHCAPPGLGGCHGCHRPSRYAPSWDDYRVIP
uniref:Putative secreted protein n=1 Tax=Anopheles darlingi TaxID=43151 RepID=A0A2M4DLT4_ANODA